MPQLDSAWKKVILGASIATVTAFLATLAVQKKKKKDSKPIKEESVMMEEAVQKPKSPSWSELVEDEHQDSLDVQKMSSDLADLGLSSPKLVPSQDSRRFPDSGVVSPDDNSVMVSTSSKQRMESGETPPDAGLGSSVCGEEPEQVKKAGKGTIDSGQGSEADDGIRLAYHFYIPHYLCGKFIGAKGSNVKQLKETTNCAIQLRQIDENGCFKAFQRHNPDGGDQVQVCLVEGTRANIDHCLELIRQRFPIDQNPELTLEQVNMPPPPVEPPSVQPLQLGLTQGAMHEVYVSNIVCGGHIFLQQPTHPTHSSLPRLEQHMAQVYGKLTVPDIPREVMEPGLVCVAKCNNCQWYRVQVVRFDPNSESCDVKFVDYGGYYNFPLSDLKQIRSDFLTLPFQALECYLGNVIPPDGKEWPAESGSVLGQMVQNQIISGRMLGVNEENVPIVHLYGWVDDLDNDGNEDLGQHEQQVRLLNRELVDRGVASWTEHIITNNQ